MENIKHEKVVPKTPELPREQETLRQEYHNKSIEKFEPDFIFLIRKLRKAVDEQTYDLLVSDDVGGRIPTLALRKVMCDRNRIGKAPKTIFLSKSQNDFKGSHLEGFLKSGQEFKRALLVSEYAHSGFSLSKLINRLDKQKIFADIAVAISSPENESSLSYSILGEGHIGHGHNLFVGRYGEGGGTLIAPDIDYIADSLAGVIRSSAEESEILSLKKPKSISGEEKRAIQRRINQAREDVALLAERTLLAVWSDKK